MGQYRSDGKNDALHSEAPGQPVPDRPEGLRGHVDSSRIPSEIDALGAAYDSLPAIVAVLDARGVILSMSAECAQAFGERARQLPGRSLLSLAHRDDRAALRRAMDAALACRDTVSDCEFRVWRGEKSPLNLSLSLRAASKTADETLLLAACSDITDRVYLADQLDARTAELADMANQLLVAEERERRRIAEDMHDSVGHTLAIAKFHVDALKADQAGGTLGNRLAIVAGLLQDAIDASRRLVFDLNLAPLENQGLDAAVEELGLTLCAGQSLEFSLASRPRQRRLDDATRLILFRVVRELLVNVVKHADAGHVRVSIGAHNERLVIRVVDDGKGFDSAQLPQDHGTGLRTIRRSLAARGGSVEIDAAPGQGTDVRISIPF